MRGLSAPLHPPASGCASTRVALQRIASRSKGLEATSAVIDAVVPGPFRLPAGLGAQGIDSRNWRPRTPRPVPLSPEAIDPADNAPASAPQPQP